MTIKNTAILCMALICFVSCKEIDPNLQIDEGHVEDNLYTSEEVGWQINIPEGWDIVTLEETNDYEEKGLEIVDGITEEDIAASQLKNLISFKKNMFNMFQSDSEIFEIEYEGEYEETVTWLKEFIYEAYHDEGIEVTVSDTSKETIDGIEFYRYEFKLYDTDDSIVLNQIIYCSLINGYDLGVTINYNDEDYKNEMLKVFRNSKFKKEKL